MVNLVKEAGIPDWGGRLVLQMQAALKGVFSPASLASSTSYANDAAAQAGGVAIGQLYRNGSVVQVRVT